MLREIDAKAVSYLKAMRAVGKVPVGVFGPWEIKVIEAAIPLAGVDKQALLCRLDGMASAMQPHGEIVMEDSYVELMKHLPICFAARGRILITGLGLGCVLRGILSKGDEIEHIDVIEKCPHVLRAVAPEFMGNPKVSIYEGDALDWPIENDTWDYAWHDIWSKDIDKHLQVLHGILIKRFYHNVRHRQGAWNFPRHLKKRLRNEPWTKMMG